MKTSFVLSLVVLSAACGRQTEFADIKYVGVGQNPDDIGASPDMYGGFVEYDHIELAGGALSLASLGAGFSSHDEINPSGLYFAPPFSTIFGMGFIFQDKVPAPDAHHGLMGVPPAVLDACWTNYQPQAFLMSRTADIGDQVRFESEMDPETGIKNVFEIDRVPEVYPPDMQDVFVYYQGVQTWKSGTLSHYLPADSGEPEDMLSEILRHPNYIPGSEVSFSFPGGISPAEAPVSSIPLPSSYVANNPKITLPDLVGGVRLSWEGPLWDSTGTQLADGGAQAACMRFFSGASDVSAEEVAACAEQPALPATAAHIPGQVYTGPWDTEAGTVLLEWASTEASEEVEANGQIVLNIRLLGEVDPDDKYLVIEKVRTSAEETPNKIKDKWDNAVEKGTVVGDLPDGFREPLPCEDEENVDYVFNPTLGRVDENGNLTDLVTTLQGDPNNLLAEVSCLLEDDGSFELSMAHIQDAYDYAQAKGFKGSLFSIGRVNNEEMAVPDVRDQNHIRREITPILLSSSAIKMGRFWVGQE
jgi:hypothetical protein